jgi:hypothetical protein|uniref:Uncharacterized protein n=1 Tax=Myoviridae sp. ctshb19 TaxID=2825194 RepID=A0A8S5UG56_9CAUD|nr:MAG TPA: hypothetical protein [Myoviridae sp. ctshb19]
MKNVKPELIVGATQPGAGATNAVLMTMFADLHFAWGVPNTVLLYLHNESTPAQILERLEKIVDDGEGMLQRYQQFGQRLIVPDLVYKTPEQISTMVQNISDNLPVEQQLWVYADLHRTFKLGCTNGAGMVVPFSVETTDAMADALSGSNVRFRCAAMSTRLAE